MKAPFLMSVESNLEFRQVGQNSVTVIFFFLFKEN